MWNECQLRRDSGLLVRIIATGRSMLCLTAPEDPHSKGKFLEVVSSPASAPNYSQPLSTLESRPKWKPSEWLGRVFKVGSGGPLEVSPYAVVVDHFKLPFWAKINLALLYDKHNFRPCWRGALRGAVPQG